MRDEPIPLGWATDNQGNPTTDAKTAMAGFLLPMAGHKGYGLAMVHEVLAGVLSGGLFSLDIPKLNMEHPQAPGVNHFFMALNVKNFMTIELFKERVDTLISMIKGSELAAGQDKIYLPGEIEFEKHKKYSREGIPYTREVVKKLRDFAHERKIPVEF